jgi:hypothetical protein
MLILERRSASAPLKPLAGVDGGADHAGVVTQLMADDADAAKTGREGVCLGAAPDSGEHEGAKRFEDAATQNDNLGI